MAMGLGQQAHMWTKPASSSVDWIAEHLLRGLSESLNPCLTRLRIIQGYILTGCERESLLRFASNQKLGGRWELVRRASRGVKGQVSGAPARQGEASLGSFGVLDRPVLVFQAGNGQVKSSALCLDSFSISPSIVHPQVSDDPILASSLGQSS